MIECVDKLRYPPISTQTLMVVKERLDYPAVTFCYKNSLKQGYDLKVMEVRYKRHGLLAYSA